MALDDVQPAVGDTRAYLEQLSKAVFRAGMSWSVVEAK
jgi:3-methyladenine DNA glycosylase Tag